MIDVRAALRNGELDGQENTPSNIYTQKLHEAQTHLTVTNHGYLGYAVIVNQRFWLGLPAGIRATLEGAMRDATSYANQIAEAENIEALQPHRRQRSHRGARSRPRKSSHAGVRRWRRPTAQQAAGSTPKRWRR